MIQEEFLCSDHICLGERIIPSDELKSKFPKWYENWKRANGEKKLSVYCLMPDYSYGISASLNAVYAVDFEKATAEYLCSFEDEINEGGLYFPSIRVGNVLVFAPMKAHRWAYYNLDTCTWKYEDIPSEVMQGKGICIKLRVLVGKSLLHILENTNVIIGMDVITGKVSYYNCLKEIRQKEGTLPNFSSVVAYGDSILLFTKTENDVYEIDTNMMQVTKIHNISLKCEGVQQAVVIRGTDWVCLLEHANASRIIKWNIRTGKVEEIKNLPIYLKNNSTLGSVLGFCNDFDGLYIIPQQDKCVVKIDYHNNKVSRIELQTEINLLERKNAFYHRCEYGHSFIILTYNIYRNLFTVFLPYDFSIAEIDFDKGILLNRRKWRVSGIENLIRNQMKNSINGIYFENEFFELQDFLDDLRGK